MPLCWWSVLSCVWREWYEMQCDSFLALHAAGSVVRVRRRAGLAGTSKHQKIWALADSPVPLGQNGSEHPRDSGGRAGAGSRVAGPRGGVRILRSARGPALRASAQVGCGGIRGGHSAGRRGDLRHGTVVARGSTKRFPNGLGQTGVFVCREIRSTGLVVLFIGWLLLLPTLLSLIIVVGVALGVRRQLSTMRTDRQMPQTMRMARRGRAI